jgi:hypothetical protein
MTAGTFPHRYSGIRQLNLTAWASDAAAHNWYVNNADHVKLVRDYREGRLSSFSSMLARLHVASGKAVNFHVRCVYCHRLITGYPEQRFCKECGQQCWEMPLF